MLNKFLNVQKIHHLVRQMDHAAVSRVIVDVTHHALNILGTVKITWSYIWSVKRMTRLLNGFLSQKIHLDMRFASYCIVVMQLV